MEVKDVWINKPLSVTPKDDRFFILDEPRRIKVTTDEGVLDYSLYFGVQSNFRSGSNLIDCVIPHIGNSKIQIAWLVHDLNYCILPNGEHPLSKKLADELLEKMLVYAGMSKWKAKLAKKSVQWFGDSAYEEIDDVAKWNQGKFIFNWNAAA